MKRSDRFLSRRDFIKLAAAWGSPGGGYQPCLESGFKAFNAFIKDWSSRV